MITIDGIKDITITCTTQAEIDAVARVCRVIKRGFVMNARVNKSELARVHEIAEQFAAPRASHDDASRQPAAHRVLMGVHIHMPQLSPKAPATITVDGVTLQFTGYGKEFRVNSDDNSARGLEPHFRAARYAYYR